MVRIYQRFAVAVASTTIVAIIGSISKAEAFEFECDRTQWQAALTTLSKTLDFGEPRLFSGTTVFSNGVSVISAFISMLTMSFIKRGDDAYQRRISTKK